MSVIGLKEAAKERKRSRKRKDRINSLKKAQFGHITIKCGICYFWFVGMYIYSCSHFVSLLCVVRINTIMTCTDFRFTFQASTETGRKPLGVRSFFGGAFLSDFIYYIDCNAMSSGIYYLLRRDQIELYMDRSMGSLTKWLAIWCLLISVSSWLFQARLIFWSKQSI